MLIINSLGGLGIFLYGLKLMSETLQKVSSSKLQSFFDKFTRNKLLGIGLGAVVTSILQSSSATTVILVGFANAGIIKLTQSISIIFGANIGTTITAQIIAFKSSALALPLIGLSAILWLVSKKAKTRHISDLLLGLGLLFLGLDIMGSYLKTLKDMPVFSQLFVQFGTNPILGIAIGAFVTVLLQSSSATTGMIIALASMGALNFQSAFALELGGNIGTTVTAQIAAINTTITAKRTAWAHTLFNVIGSSYMLILFYVKLNGHPIFLHLIDRVTPGSVFAGENVTRHIANAHTVFNVFNAIMLFPFINKLARLTEYIVPGVEDMTVPVSYIDDRLTSSPTVALLQSRKELQQVNRYVGNLSESALKTLLNYKKSNLKKSETMEKTINTLHDRLTHFLIGLNVDITTERQRVKMNHLIHTVDHLERAGDYAMAIIHRVHEKSVIMPPALLRLIEPLFNVINDTSTYINVRLGGEKPKMTLVRINQRSIELEHMLRREHLDTMRNKSLSIKQGLVLSIIINDIERLAAHLTKAGHLIPDFDATDPSS